MNESSMEDTIANATRIGQCKVVRKRPSILQKTYAQNNDINQIECLICDTMTDYRQIRYMPNNEPYRQIFLDDLNTTEAMKKSLVKMQKGSESNNDVKIPVCMAHISNKTNIHLALQQKSRGLVPVKQPQHQQDAGIEVYPGPGGFADLDKRGERMLLMAFPAEFRANTAALEIALDNILDESNSRINEETAKCAVMDVIRSYVVGQKRIDHKKIDGVSINDILVKVLEKMANDTKKSWQRIVFDAYPYQHDGLKILIPLDPKVCPYLYHPCGMIRDIGSGNLLSFLQFDDRHGYPIVCLSSSANKDFGLSKNLVSNSKPNKFIVRPAGYAHVDKLIGGVVVINERDLVASWNVHKGTFFVRGQGRPQSAFRKHHQPTLTHLQPGAGESHRSPVPNGTVRKILIKRPYPDGTPYQSSRTIDSMLKSEPIDVEAEDAAKKQRLLIRQVRLAPPTGSNSSESTSTTLDLPVGKDPNAPVTRVRPSEPIEYQNPIVATGEKLVVSTSTVHSNTRRPQFIASMPSRVNSRTQFVEEKPVERLVQYTDTDYRPLSVDTYLVNLIDTKKSSLSLDEKQRLFEAVNERLYDNDVPLSSIATSYRIKDELIMELAEMTVNKFYRTLPDGCFAPRNYDPPKIYTRMPTRENWDDLWSLIAKAIRAIRLKYVMRSGREIREANALMECILFGTQTEQAFKKYVLPDQWCFHQLYFSVLRQKEGRDQLLRLIRARKYLICVRGGIVRDEAQANPLKTWSVPTKPRDCGDQTMSLEQGLFMISEMLVDPKKNNRMKLYHFSGNKEKVCSEIDNVLNYMAVPYWLKNSVIPGILDMFLARIPADEICTSRSITLNTFLLLSCMVRTFMRLDNYEVYENVYIGSIYRPKPGFVLVNEETFSMIRLGKLKKFCLLEQLNIQVPKPMPLTDEADEVNAVDLMTASVKNESEKFIEGEEGCSSWEVTEPEVDESELDQEGDNELMENGDSGGLSALQLMSNVQEETHVKQEPLDEEETSSGSSVLHNILDC